MVEAGADGRAVALGATKQRAVLAMLALRANSPVSADRLTEGLWGEEAPRSAAKMVQHYISQLRKLLDFEQAEILTRGRGYELRLPADAVDALRFERLVAAAARHGQKPNGAAREALSLWRGAPLDDLADEPFAAAEIRRLEELWLRARELATDEALAAGEHLQLVGQIQDLVVQHPLRERFRGQLMLALYRSGRQAEALDAYTEARSALVEELGIEPSRELRELHQGILEQDAALDLVVPSEGASKAARKEQQSVTATFLFADIEGSTRLLGEIGRDAYGQVLSDFYRLMRAAVSEENGREVGTQGDSLFMAFRSAADAVAAAAAAQRSLAANAWPADSDVRVRMGLHTGEATLAAGDYFGLAVHRAARICAAANGGQVLLSQTTCDVTQDDLPTRLGLRDLGEQRLKDLHRPERLFELQIEGLPAELSPPRTTVPRSAAAMPAVRYQLLGPVAALVEGRSVELGGPRQRGALVVLLTQAGSLVPASRIIDAIWGDEAPATAAHLVQRTISQLRKALGRHAIETRGPGYLARIDPDALDLHVFERLARSGTVALHDGRSEEAAGLLREALALWRGPALADLAGQPFLEHEAARLEEMRLLALERAVEADLGCGRHADALMEAEELVHAHPLRERPRELMMRALYGTGRHAEALDAYRRAEATFVDELGIEPGPALRELKQAILRQDQSLAPQAASGFRGAPATTDRLRTLLVAPLGATGHNGLVALAERLARQPRREIVLAETVTEGRELARVSRRLQESREALRNDGLEARAAAFTSVSPGADLARLAAEQDIDLLLSDAPEHLLEDVRLRTLLEHAPCDVGVLVGGGELRGPVVVPFAGAAHDWTAVEIGAWLARNSGEPLQLAGASTSTEGRDASRLLANASLAVQHALGVPAEPLLVDPEPEALVAAAEDAGIVAIGLTERWRREGLGRTRGALATAGTVPVLLVRRGVRPGGLAPRESDTRFTWTVAGP
jgi:DNA-binding SARP family transcriptional activator